MRKHSDNQCLCKIFQKLFLPVKKKRETAVRIVKTYLICLKGAVAAVWFWPNWHYSIEHTSEKSLRFIKKTQKMLLYSCWKVATPLLSPPLSFPAYPLSRTQILPSHTVGSNTSLSYRKSWLVRPLSQWQPCIIDTRTCRISASQTCS
jgi:hypothetical protein